MPVELVRRTTGLESKAPRCNEVGVEQHVVIPSYDYLVLVRKGSNPVQLILEFSQSAAVTQVTSVQEDVTFLDRRRRVVRV